MTSLFANTETTDHSASGALFASVSIHRGIERTRAGTGTEPGAALTYRVPASLTASAAAQVGQLVTVPLGRGDTPATGVIIALGGRELLGNLDPGKVKDLLSIAPAVLPTRLLDLAKWIAEYYVCPLGMVLLTMLPAAVKKQIGRKAVSVLSLAVGAEKMSLAEGAESRRCEEGEGGERGEKRKTGPSRAAKPRAADVKLQAAWRRVQALDAELWPLTARALCANVEGLSPSMIKRLVTGGALVESRQTQVSARADPLLAEAMAGPREPIAPPTLTPDQARVVAAIAPRLGAFGVHVIRGVTGSGKTEVYLRLIADLLSREPDASAIVLVPEIALTPQTARRFLDRFGAGSVAVLHSALSESQRHAQWEAAAAGRVRVVVGARSAVFAPLARVRLIVADEEHDTSYKQDQLPRYHARDVAVKRAHTEGCCVLLGSATPSLETYANTVPGAPGAPAPKYTLHELPVRVGASALPTVRIVDLMDERRLRAKQSPDGWKDRQLRLIGPTLEAELHRTLDERGQAILLLNRRGFANYLCCPSPSCGFVMHCDHCDATVVYHRGEQYHAGGTAGFVRCHHCLAEVRLPDLCPSCKAKRLNTFGLGTQRVEEELERTFARHGLAAGDTLLRIDSDTMHTARDYFTALGRFADGRARVLLGTQMIAKGLDFPNVRLVGIVNADTALALPDFRAYERTFQLVCQVAGRAGRREAPGLVIVQTVHPNAPPIVLAARHDYHTFAREELRTRTQAGLPPASRMARIVCRDLSHAKATRAAAELAGALRAAIAAQRAPEGAIVLRGPMPAPIARIDDHHRVVIEIMTGRGGGRGLIQAVMAAVRAQGLLTSDTHTAVDVDPISLL